MPQVQAELLAFVLGKEECVFWRILGIPEPHLPTREETDIGEIDLIVEICCSSARWFGEEPPEADFNHKAVAPFGLQTGLCWGEGRSVSCEL